MPSYSSIISLIGIKRRSWSAAPNPNMGKNDSLWRWHKKGEHSKGLSSGHSSEWSNSIGLIIGKPKPICLYSFGPRKLVNLWGRLLILLVIRRMSDLWMKVMRETATYSQKVLFFDHNHLLRRNKFVVFSRLRKSNWPISSKDQTTSRLNSSFMCDFNWRTRFFVERKSHFLLLHTDKLHEFVLLNRFPSEPKYQH